MTHAPVPGAVSEVMLRTPAVLAASADVGDVRRVFTSTHVHLVLITATGVLGEPLLGTLERSDVDGVPSGERALPLARVEGRTVRADLAAEDVRLHLLDSGRRRVAVVDEDDRLLGLLCLKRHGNGFCTDAGVASRRADRRRGDAEDGVAQVPQKVW